MYRYYAKVIIMLFVAVCMANYIVFAESMPQSEFKYGEGRMDNPAITDRIKNAVVMRVGNREAYVNNVRCNLDDDYENLKPYQTNDDIYIPLKFTLEAIGIKVDEKEGKASFIYKDKTYSIADGEDIGNSSYKAEISNHRLCISANAFAELFNKKLFLDKGLIIISDIDNIFDVEKDAKLLEEIRDNMAYEWGNVVLGPEGFVIGIYVHPLDPTLMYCKTDVGGIYKWNSESETWTPLTDMFGRPDNENLQGIEGLALDPSDTNTIYIAAGASRGITDPNKHDVLKSTDRGKTWTKTHLNQIYNAGGDPSRLWGECIAVDPKNSQVVYTGTNLNGLFRSFDASKAWSKVDEIPNGDITYGSVNTVYFDKDSEMIDGKTSTIYIGVAGSGVWVTRDAGKTFSLMSGSPKYPGRMEIRNGILYVSSTIGELQTKTDAVPGFYKYENSQWTNLSPKQASNKNFDAFAINPTNPNFIMIFQAPFSSPDDNTHVFRTYDGGASWKDMGRLDSSAQAIYNPLNNNELFFTWGFGIHAIKDVNAPSFTIRDIDKGIEEFCAYDVLSLRGSKGIKLISSVMDKGDMVSYDLHTRAKRIFDMKVGYACEACESDNRFIARAGCNGWHTPPAKVYLSKDYGETWLTSSWNVNNFPINVALSATLQENGYPIIMVLSTVGDQGIFRTKDFGKTWEKLAPEVTMSGRNNIDGRYLIADKVDGKTFYYADYGQTIYRTTDGGDTWQIINALPRASTGPTQLVSVPGAEGSIWLANSNGLFYTADGGKRWSKFDDVKDAVSISFGPKKPNSSSNLPAAYMLGTCNGIFGVFRSDDLGTTWKRINDNSNIIPGRSIKIEADQNVYGRVFIPIAGRGVYYGQPIEVDDTLPHIEVAQSGSSNQQDADYAVREPILTLNGSLNKPAEVRVNNIQQTINSQYRFKAQTELKEGENKVRIEALDSNKQKAVPVYLDIRYIPGYVGISFDFDADTEQRIKKGVFTISGRVNTRGTVYLNGDAVNVNDKLRFEKEVKLSPGSNKFTVYAEAEDGKRSKEYEFLANYDIDPPVITLNTLPETVNKNYLLVKGTSNEQGSLRINGAITDIQNKLDFATFVPLKKGINTIKVESKDIIGNVAKPQMYIVTCTDDSAGALDNIKTPYINSTDVTIDGVLNESFWSLDKELRKVVEGNVNNYARFDVKWSDEALYVAVDVLDDVLYNKNTAAYQNDCIEVYIDADNSKGKAYDSKDQQLAFVTNGAYPSGTDCKTKITDYGYTMEIKIPWSKLAGIKPKEGYQLGFDIDMVDNDGKTSGQRSGVVVYRGTITDWKDTSEFSTLTLSK